MTRSTLEALLRVDGYHNDRASFTRHYCAERIAIAKAQAAFRAGAAMRAAGVACSCGACKDASR